MAHTYFTEVANELRGSEKAKTTKTLLEEAFPKIDEFMDETDQFKVNVVNDVDAKITDELNRISASAAPDVVIAEVQAARNSAAFGVNYATMDARTEAHEQKTKDNTTRIAAIENKSTDIPVATTMEVTASGDYAFDSSTSGTKPFTDGVLKVYKSVNMPVLNNKYVVLQEATNYSTNSYQIAKRLYRYNTGKSNYEWTPWQVKTI